MNYAMRALNYLFFILLMTCFVAVWSVQAADVTVGWTSPNDPRVTGYNVYVAPTQATLRDNIDATVNIPATQATITGLTVGTGYYIGVTSRSATLESDMSDILHYTVTPPIQVIEVPGRPSAITIKFTE